jgi:hypothetical protein
MAHPKGESIVSHTKTLTKSAGFLSWRGKEPRIGRSPLLQAKRGLGEMSIIKKEEVGVFSSSGRK